MERKSCPIAQAKWDFPAWMASGFHNLLVQWVSEVFDSLIE